MIEFEAKLSQAPGYADPLFLRMAPVEDRPDELLAVWFEDADGNALETVHVNKVEFLAAAVTVTMARDAVTTAEEGPTPPAALAHLYEGETDPRYLWPNPPRGELP